jgi:hypothetical protein
VDSRLAGAKAEGFPRLNAPLPYEIDEASGDRKAELIKARAAAEHTARLESAQVYVSTGPLLELRGDGRWRALGTEGSVALASGTYVIRGRDVIVAHRDCSSDNTRSARSMVLQLQGRDLVSGELEWALRQWQDHGRRTYRYVGDADADSTASAGQPQIVLRSAVVGNWRLDEGSARLVIEDLRRSAENLRAMTKGLDPGVRSQLEQYLQVLEVPEDLRYQVLQLREDGKLRGAIRLRGVWRTHVCGDWVLAGDCLVLWVVEPSTKRTDVRVLEVQGSELTERLPGGACLRYGR